MPMRAITALRDWQQRRHPIIRAVLWVLLLPYVLVIVYSIVPPISTVMLVSLFTGQGMHRDWVPLERVSPSLVRAVLAAEDARFCEHAGIDFEAIDKAIEKSARTGKRMHGGSTISAQTAKNLFLWNGRSWLRKALEAPLTLWLDFVLTKRRILELYVNVAEWGPGVFGIEAAAQTQFKKPASALTQHESALLATALPNPKRFRANAPRPYHRARAGTIEARMRDSALAACVLKR